MFAQHSRLRPVHSAAPPLLLSLLIALSGCGEEIPQSPLPSEPDMPAQVAPLSILALAPEPFFSVGRADGPDADLFSRIAGAARVQGGDVIVAVQGYHEIRRFAANGDHLWTAGHEGEGPGEFRAVEIPGNECVADSLIVARDSRNNTITFLDGDGGLIRSERFERFPYGYGLTCAPAGWSSPIAPRIHARVYSFA